MGSSTESVLEWHRVSVLGRLIALWTIAVGFLFAGMVGTGLHLFAPPSLGDDARFVAAVLGWPSAVLGPVIGIMGILQVLTTDNRAIVVLRDGLRLQGFQHHAVIPWADLRDVKVVGRWPHRHLQLVTDQHPNLLLPAHWIGRSGPELAARLLEIRRRALLGVPDRLP